jgi:hypothetical protein
LEVHNFGDQLCHIERLFFSPDGQRLVACGNQDHDAGASQTPRHTHGGTHIWDVATGQEQRVFKNVDWALLFLPDN